MLSGSTILGALAALSFTGLASADGTSQAVIGFNSAANTTDNKFKQFADFKKEFTAAKALAGTDGKFTSTRLYTMIQGDKLDGYISAIDAAIETQTSMLLGMWTSAGAEMVEQEIKALLNAIQAKGTAFTSLVVGISVGSEDVYRTTALGIESKAGPGCSPQELVKYIDQVRTALSATPLAQVKIGHVDTYNVWSDHGEEATAAMPDLIKKVDFIGMNAFPYWEKTKDNPIAKAKDLFWKDYDAVVAKAGNKEIWITETGWPSIGKTQNKAEANVENAGKYWREVGCNILQKGLHMWYYILADDLPEGVDPAAEGTRPVFGITKGGISTAEYSTEPNFPLAC